MASWAELVAGAPELAEVGRTALERGGAWDGLLTTIRGEGLPRTHPVNVGIVEGCLLVFVQGHSAKARDLAEDGRYALHAIWDPAAPHEFLVRGHARPVTDVTLRVTAIARWPFHPADDYPLFELEIEHALFGLRPTADDWPPRYTSWRPVS